MLLAVLALAACPQGPPRPGPPAPRVPHAPQRPPPAAPVPAPKAAPPAAPASAVLRLPVVGIDAAALRDSFSEMRGSEHHEALDILAPRGTPVVAVADGRVAKLFTSKPGGLTVYQFDSSGRLAYYYAHLDRYADGLHEGALLKAGDPVGAVGSTGNASADAPHLHFAVFELGPERQWWKGTAINPYPLLGGR